jgi:hypothetical protein
MFEVAFATDPFATPTYVDLSDRLLRARIRRGRQHELDVVEAGSADVQLDNQDRALEPEYAGSAYYPNVVPLRRARLSVTHNAATYRRFTGFVERWPPAWELPNYAEMPLTLVDGFEALTQATLPAASYPAEGAGARIGRVLDAVGWPAGDRSLDAGQSQVQAKTIAAGDELDALTHIKEVADSELGIFFIDGQGRAVFHERHRRLKSPFTTSQATFGDADGELAYEALEPSFDKDGIRNDWRVTREGGTVQTAEDAASIARYMRRTGTRAPLFATDSEALDMARFLVSRYKDPYLRFDAIGVEPLADDALWTQVLSRELGDRITVRRRPPGGGATVEKQVHIDGISEEIVPAIAWRTTWQLTPADLNQYLVLDHASLGRLDFNKLAY